MKTIFLKFKQDHNDSSCDEVLSSIRIGICGAPGAGKSSLIERLGLNLINEKGLNIAVLAIDPSSHRTGGSILGDATRMDDLARHEKAFVRPSPTKGHLGGIAINTSQIISLCEHVGFDAVITETVGVG